MAVPGFLGGDLAEKEALAYEEGHDADIPSNEGVEGSSQNGGLEKETGAEQDHNPVHSTSSRSSAVVPTDDAEKGQAVLVSDERQDPNIVDWDGPDDPENPQNWSPAKKWAHIAVLSVLTLLTPLASSMFAPGVPELMRDFHSTSEDLATFVVSVYLLGFAAGPLVVAPLSEMYGRLPVYHVCNVIFIGWTVACALAKSMNMLIGFRFLAGCFGIAPITNGGGTIADLMAPEKRGAAMAIWAMGPLLGPVIGPVAGGFLAEDVGWRWM